MADWDPVTTAPGPLRITVRPKPLDNMTPAPPDPWAPKAAPSGVVSQAGSADPWAPKAVTPTAEPSADVDPWSPKPEQPKGVLANAMEPITSYLPTQKQMAGESLDRAKQGLTEMGTSGQRMKGAFHAATGALGYVTSPIDAAARTLLGNPVQKTTGIPREYTEFATELALPGIGLASSPWARSKEPIKAIERVLSPTTVSPEAGNAEAMLRSAGGTAARDTAKTTEALEGAHAMVNALPEAERLSFLDYVEGRSTGAVLSDPRLQPLANTLKDAFDQRMNKIQALPSGAQAQFIQDYFPHFWQDPAKAANVGQNFGTGGMSRQGSRASLNKRTVPTIADGIAQGLVPVTTNPIEATMRYVRSMDHFIASQSVLDTAKANGTIRYIRPKSMGASGHPDGYRIPEGWVPLEGRGAVNAAGAHAYAPADWARVYNNFIDRGIHKNADWGKLYDAAQSTSNAITSLELGLSGYHAFTMANEAIISDVAKGISELVGGRPIRAIGSVAKAPLAPYMKYRLGKKVEQEYLGLTQGTPDMRKIVDLLEQAGGRAKGKDHAADYRYTQMGSYWTAFKRGALRQQMTESGARARTGPVAAALEGGRMIGRIMETVSQPLFEKYIPRLKNGAFYDTMKQWLDAHPNASQAEQVSAARQIWDSIDNRFGELVQDNVFWNKTMKQVAQLGMRSYSWNLGTVREIGGGVKDIVGTVARGEEWSPRASYVVALPIVVATINAVYQKLMTGKDPESVDDLVSARTGGTAPGFGSRGQVQERAMMPGYQKDIIGWYEDWRREAANKIASGPRTAVIDPMMNSDWKGDPVFHAGTPALQDYFTHVLGSMGPISVKQMLQGNKKGSEIGPVQSSMGIRPAPAALQDPAGTKRGLAAIERRREQREKAGERKQQRLYDE